MFTPKQPPTSGIIVTSRIKKISEPNHIKRLCHIRKMYGADAGKSEIPAEVKFEIVSKNASSG